MCQKAFAGPYGALVTAPTGLTWTRGAPARFRSSNRVRRGFCAACGTPLTFEPDGGDVDLAIFAFDDPSGLEPVVQLARDQRQPWADRVADLPERDPREAEAMTKWFAEIASHQHPDHDTDRWPPEAQS
jgi:hypothetical protein